MSGGAQISCPLKVVSIALPSTEICHVNCQKNNNKNKERNTRKIWKLINRRFPSFLVPSILTKKTFFLAKKKKTKRRFFFLKRLGINHWRNFPHQYWLRVHRLYCWTPKTRYPERRDNWGRCSGESTRQDAVCREILSPPLRQLWILWAQSPVEICNELYFSFWFLG